MFKVTPISGKGHGVVATQDISPGLDVFTEEALIVGPGSGDACVECLTVEAGNVGSCPECGHTLCQKCLVKSDDRKIWHTGFECGLMKGLEQDPATVFNFIFPLRLAILRQNNRATFDKVMLLQDHLEERLEQV
jgi:hypothetical protein